MLEDEFTLYIYTDGSSYSHPRKSGVGIVFKYNDENGEEKTYSLSNSGYKGGTNNQMEIKACTIALIEARRNPLFSKFKNVVIYSDSRYVIDNYINAQYIWSRNKWTLQTGEPVSNTLLWKELLDAKKKLKKQVEIQKVKAHSSDLFNRQADKLAKASAKLPWNKSPQVTQATRKFSKKSTEKRSVKIYGQIMWIHIIERVFFKEQNIDRYRYEVMNKESNYFENVDFVYSKTYMKRNHIYKVRVNEDQNFPRIVEILEVINRRDWVV